MVPWVEDGRGEKPMHLVVLCLRKMTINKRTPQVYTLVIRDGMKRGLNRRKKANAVFIYPEACSIRNKWMELPARDKETKATVVGVAETPQDGKNQYYV